MRGNSLRDATLWRLLLLLLVKSGLSLRISGVKVPKVVVSGSSVTLTCSYEIRTDRPDPIYSVKWYRGVDHFYEYIPTRNPPIRIFPLPNVHVDKSHSERSSVTLRGVTTDTSGSFRCEVLGDKPHFETDDHTQNMTVVDIPEWGPQINGLNKWDRVKSDEMLRAQCLLGPSNPPADINWRINNERVPHFGHVNAYLQEDERGQQVQVSDLRITAKEEMFNRGALTITCSANIFDVYRRQENLTLIHEGWRYPSDTALYSSGSPLGTSLLLLALTVATMGMVLA